MAKPRATSGLWPAADVSWGRWLAKRVRLGARKAPVVGRAVTQVVGVANETREAFGRGLRGEPEPPPTAAAASAEQVATWYANLEIEVGADLEAVHAAWKRLQRRYHPDLHAGDGTRAARATVLVQDLNAAYVGLKDHLGR